MTTPTPEKLAVLLARTQSRWKQPERHMVDCEIALARRFLLGSQEELLRLQTAFDDACGAVAIIEQQLPIAKDVHFWAGDPHAIVPLRWFAEKFGVTTEKVAEQLFQGVSKDVLALASNCAPLCCPLCLKKK